MKKIFIFKAQKIIEFLVISAAGFLAFSVLLYVVIFLMTWRLFPAGVFFGHWLEYWIKFNSLYALYCILFARSDD